MPENFNDLVDAAMAIPGRALMRPVVEKEILHYDIFHALDGAGLLRDLVFQGGTSLRLCRGSNRFSEDLDFAGGRDFTVSKMHAIKACIEKHVGDRYGLAVDVKEPKETAALPDCEVVHVDRWQVSVVTAPDRPDIPRQRIKLEIANIPAYTRELVPLQQNYEFLAGYGLVTVNAETIDEVLADKVVAFPASVKNIRYRDIWDIAWLQQKGAKLVPEMVEKKLGDYHIKGYKDLLEQAIEHLAGHIDSRAFIDQMSRFIDAETMARTLEKPGFAGYLKNAIGDIFKNMHSHLSDARPTVGPSFRM